MEITKQQMEGFVEVTVKGRLDAHWADHLSKSLEETIREGGDCIRMDMHGVEYISSIGIRVLVSAHSKLSAIDGDFVIVRPSETVNKILDMVGLKSMLMPIRPPRATENAEPARALAFESFRMEVFGLPSAGSPMELRTMGDPGLLETCGYTEGHCTTVGFPEDAFGLGLGAFGSSFAECQTRFGEFLAVSGALAYQASDGSNSPDYLMAEGSFVPDLQVLYGMKCQGSFQYIGRFEVAGEARAVGLEALADACLSVCGGEHAAFALVAESAGLVGAALRRSPIQDGKAALFAHPEIRTWLSFTTEGAFSRALAVAVGIISRSPDAAWSPFVRPLNGKTSISGHVHAVAFPYRPLPRGRIELHKTVRALFAQESPLGLLHLLGDDRGTTGVAESEFVRGACWTAPLSMVRS